MLNMWLGNVTSLYSSLAVASRIGGLRKGVKITILGKHKSINSGIGRRLVSTNMLGFCGTCP